MAMKCDGEVVATSLPSRIIEACSTCPHETVLVSWANESMFGHWCSPQPISYVQQILSCKVKGNLCIDPVLGKKMVLPFACIKARKQGRCDDLGYGIDVVRTTTRAMKTPGVLRVSAVASADYVDTLNDRYCNYARCPARFCRISFVRHV